MKFGEKVKDARKKAGYTQEQLAEKLGVSRQAVTKWETGNGIPDVDNLKYIAQVLNVSMDYLLDEGTELDMSVMREPIDLTRYEGKGRWEKKNKIITEKFPDAKLHPLMSEEKLSKGQKILDEAIGWFTSFSFGSVNLAKAFDNLDKQYYLVEKKDEEYLVLITDEFMEIRRLPTKVILNKHHEFTIGNWIFRDCGELK